MDTIEGTLRVLRISRDTEPEPWTYELSFEPYTQSDIPRPYDVIGDEQLGQALREGLGLPSAHVDDSVQKARQDHVVVHHVRLTAELRKLLMT